MPRCWSPDSDPWGSKASVPFCVASWALGEDLDQVSEGVWCLPPTLSSGSGPPRVPAGLPSALHPLCCVHCTHVFAEPMRAYACVCQCPGTLEGVLLVCLLAPFFLPEPGWWLMGGRPQSGAYLADFCLSRWTWVFFSTRDLAISLVPTPWCTAAALPLYPCSL